MHARLRLTLDRIDALNVRERGLLMLAVLAVLVGLWELVLFGPLQQQRSVLRQQVQKARLAVATLNQTITEVENKQSEDPNVALRAKLAAAKQRNRHLDGQLKAITAGLIPPREMATVLEGVLKAQHHLKLISVANQPATPVMLHKGDDSDEAKVFRHGLTLTLEGRYLDTLKYLRALNRLPWHFYWDSLELKVENYPTSRVTLTVHTLNLEEGWIGV
jgi:MSHA biogenesis protein MshJ